MIEDLVMTGQTINLQKKTSISLICQFTKSTNYRKTVLIHRTLFKLFEVYIKIVRAKKTKPQVGRRQS